MHAPEVARLIREDFPPEAMTLVAVSGHQKTVEGAMFDDHLLKPAPLDRVVEILNGVVEAAGLQSD